MDRNTKQFYVEMGYTEEQISQAYEESKSRKIDILDALNNPVPPPINNNYTTQSPFPLSSFLAPLARIRTSQYEILYSKHSRSSQSAKLELRQSSNPVGLLNVSNCCYLNSLLQCYFLISPFVSQILQAKPLISLDQVIKNTTKFKRVKNQYELLKTLQNFFSMMALTSKKYLDPSEVLKNLVGSLGEKLSYGEEKDLFEINLVLIDRLSECLNYTQKYYEEEVSQENEVADGKSKYNSIFQIKKGSMMKRLFYGCKVQSYESNPPPEPPVYNDFCGLILNPSYGNLSSALDNQFTFSVEVNGQQEIKRTYITEQPQCLFLYINRTSYDRQENQMLKNQQKFTFDFVMYLDRYLYKYKQDEKVSYQLVNQLTKSKQRLNKHKHHLEILAKKIQECYQHAQQLDGWIHKFPTQQELQDERSKIQKGLLEVEKQLEKVESRKEKYILVYIFVHRGDAISGHYWGYGRNGDSWYRFDINTKKMKEDQITADMQKSSGTPYALVYVKENNIPFFEYKYHLSKESTVLDYFSQNNNHFLTSIDPLIGTKIIQENVTMHRQIIRNRNEAIKKKVQKDYIARYMLIKKMFESHIGKSKPIIHIYQNLSLFLYSKGEFQLCKFTLFQQSLLYASSFKITINCLFNSEVELLAVIQKKMKKSYQGEFALRQYGLIGKQLTKFKSLEQEFQLGLFESIWALETMALMNRYLSEGEQSKGKVQLGARVQLVEGILDKIEVRGKLERSDEYKNCLQIIKQPLYISRVNQQIVYLILFKLVLDGYKIVNIQNLISENNLHTKQIITINAANKILIDTINLDQKYAHQQAQNLVDLFYRKDKDVNVKLERRQSNSEKMTSEHSINSPNKSANKSKPQRLTCSRYHPQAINLSIFECWKVEILEKSKVNYQLNAKIHAFLKSLSQVVMLYRKIEATQALLPAQDLGVHVVSRVESKPIEQSLI